VSPHYFEKIECSTAQLFFHISQNIIHIRLVRMINWEVFLFNRFIFSLISIFECG